MSKNNKNYLIKVTENGPYIVSADVPLAEKIITPKGKSYVLKEGRKLLQGQEYSLCRCGQSKNAPFCDGTHEKINFRGTETASRQNYSERARVF
jgi:CDGSH-type Zn-finger protein